MCYTKCIILIILLMGTAECYVLDSVCPTSVGRVKNIANITSTRQCEVIRRIETQRILYGSEANNHFICYDNNNLQTDFGTWICTMPSSIVTNITRGIPILDSWNPELIYNASEHNNITYWDFLSYEIQKCSGSTSFCVQELLWNGVPCATGVNISYTCRYEWLVTVVKVDCGQGFFTPVFETTDIECLDSYFDNDPGESAIQLRQTDLQSAIVNDLFQLTLTFRQQQFNSWMLLELIIFDETLHDYVVTFQLVSLNKTEDSLVVPLGSILRIDSIYGDFFDGRFIVWNNDLHKIIPLFEGENVTSVDMCNRGECSKCERSLTVFYCKISNFGWWKTGFVIFLIVVALLCIPWFLALCTMIFNFLNCCICTPIKKMRAMKKQRMLKKASTKKNSLANEESNDEYEMQLLEEEERGKELKKKKDQESKKKGWFRKQAEPKTMEVENMSVEERKLFFAGKKPSAFTTSLLILCLVSLAQSQCTDAIVDTSTFRSCVAYNSSHKVCSFKINVELALDTVGQVNCLSFLTNKTEKPWTMNITFESLEVQARLVWQYPTVDWIPEFRPSKSCFLQSCCTYHTTKSCSQWESNPVPNPCNKFEATYLTAPGFTGCMSKPGCAANGCFSCHESCNYYRANFRPSNNQWNVSTFGLITTTATFSIQYENSPKYFFSTESPEYTDSIFKVEVIGILSDFQTQFAKKVVSSFGTAYYTDASEPNEPRAGVPGDLQSPSIRGFYEQADQVSFDRAIVDIQVDSNGAFATYARSGISNMDRSHQFPTMIDGFLWFYDPLTNSIRAKINRRMSGLIKLQTLNNVEITERVEAVCPQLQGTPTITGCYDCAGGASITVLLKSSCYPGSCVATSSDVKYGLVGNALLLSNDYESYNITLLTHENLVDLAINIRCNGGDLNFTVSGSLNSDVDIYNSYNQTATERHDEGSSLNSPFLDWLKNFLGINKYWMLLILYISIALLGVLFIVVGLVILYKVFSSNKVNIAFASNKTDYLRTMTGVRAFDEQIQQAKGYQKLGDKV